MGHRRKTLTLTDAVVVVAGLLVIVWLQVRDTTPAPRPLYTVEKQVDTFGAPPRRSQKNASAAYEAFLTIRGYYGAFASTGDGAFGWSDNYTSQAHADKIALARCAEFSEGCQVIARLRPEVVIEFQGRDLSHAQAEALDRFQGLPNHKAIALSDSGAWGAAWARTAPFVAKQAALTQCRTNIRKQYGPNRGDTACHLVVPE
ncbi:hypothetical protein [Roseovarius sp. 2305UL8-3]|uniref:hypothetical protein n=1 Tax=Roseovarius conchicola TaxID=3121636 RepID=UPI00352909C7